MFDRAVKWIRLPRVTVSAATVILGFCLLLWPHASLTLAVRLCGAAALLTGVALSVGYMAKPSSDYFRQDLHNGLYLIAAGLLLLLFTNLIIGILPLIVGLVIAVSGAMGVGRALVWRKAGWPMQWLQLLLSACTVALGVSIVFSPVSAANTVVSLLGAALILVGITELWHAQYARRFD